MEDIVKRLMELEVTTGRQEEQIKTLFTRQDELKRLADGVHEMAASLQVLTAAQQGMEKKVSKLADDVDEIKSKPAKRWDGLVVTAVTAVLTAVITFILTSVGLK